MLTIKMLVAKVAIARPLRDLYLYTIPDDMKDDAVPGRRVVVEFGKTVEVGFIVALEEMEADKEKFVVKPILELIDKEQIISDDIFKLILFASKYYHGEPGEFFKLTGIFKRMKIKRFIVAKDDLADDADISEKAKAVFDILKKRKQLTKESLKTALGTSSALLDKYLYSSEGRRLFKVVTEFAMVKKRFSSNDSYQYEADLGSNFKKETVDLSENQRSVFNQILENTKSGRFSVDLLFGTTGSGKTEIYAKLADELFRMNRSILILAPEIAIAEHIFGILRKRVNCEPVLYHSDMKESRREEIISAAREKVSVLVGTRSAIFIGIKNLGAIVVDEEYDSGLRQSRSPYYNGRDLAIKRASILDIPAILGAATPSLESFYNARIGKYRLLNLPARKESKGFNVKIVKVPGFKLDISDELDCQIRSRLEKYEQIILFINRRGFGHYLGCKDCSEIIYCPNCSVSLVYHKSRQELRCHICEERVALGLPCKRCGCKEFHSRRSGSENIEEMLKEIYENAKIGRLDKDSVSHRGKRQDIISAIKRHDLDIVVGTQMIVKGHDIHNVTLTAALYGDDLLSIPDFRVRERAYQVLAQLSGRSGRGMVEGLSIIQSSMSGETVFDYVKDNDYEKFYESEIKIRKASKFPPFSRIALIKISSTKLESGNEFISELEIRLSSEEFGNDTRVLGPSEGLIFKTFGRYNWRLLLISRNWRTLSLLIERILSFIEALKPAKKVMIDLEVDPETVI